MPWFWFKFAHMKKRFTIPFVIICSLILVSAQPVQAQFWKKIFGKEEKRKNKKPKQEIPVKKEEKQEKN